METKKRTAIKSITYRFVVTTLLGIISWHFTGSLFETSAITITYAVLATVAYYIHERMWFKVTWGKIRKIK